MGSVDGPAPAGERVGGGAGTGGAAVGACQGRRPGGIATSGAPGRPAGAPVLLDLGTVDAVIFGMDGVIADTSAARRRAWRRLVEDHLSRVGGAGGEAAAADD
ncbi:MAG TPA: hypothetical protein VFW63_07365, partial [Acidimicrobiales bacterium]|nr:hypothetical protein [Acidimicrobiales bacterium]